ncbi:adenylosuccinate synthetase [Lacibacter sp. MH-610]|uniref:adenylosuccinate synthetase n=1 Tax=Lacibacter sp. MH-610 TaxID=3020883 RepID=UPI003892B93A
MPVSVIFGGQFGSEGKGKVAHYFAKELKAKAVIRVGGPNSGHTVIKPNGEALVLKQLPTASILDNVYCIISSGSYINVDILLKEVLQTGIKDEFLYIDPFAVIITEEDILNESKNGLKESIGSTGSGIGSALSNRVNRMSSLRFAKDVEALSKYICNTKSMVRHFLLDNERIIIEGTQGFGLSLLHSDLYPYTTSRDTSAAAFVSEAGISPLDVDDVIMVIRTYPIRVGGNSGPLPKEINWEKVTNDSKSKFPLIEFTSVTNKVRRVAEFDAEVVKRAIEVNNPTKIVLNHCDYFDLSGNELLKSQLIISKVKEIENLINSRIGYLGLDRDSIVERNLYANNTIAKVLK